MSKIFVLSCLLFIPGMVHPAPPVCQVLDRPASDISFEANLGPLPLTGRLSDYSGEWFVDPRSPENSRIRFEADPGSLAFSGYQNASLMIQQLLESLPRNRVIFNSTSVRRISTSRYQVEGTIRRGENVRTISFPVELLNLDARRASVKAAFEGSGIGLDPPLNQASGRVTAYLSFRGSAAPFNNCPKTR